MLRSENKEALKNPVASNAPIKYASAAVSITIISCQIPFACLLLAHRSEIVLSIASAVANRVLVVAFSRIANGKPYLCPCSISL
jgi:hypothetical protein